MSKSNLYNARVCMDEDDRKMLDELAKAHLRNKAQTIRQLIRDAYEQLKAKDAA